MISHGSFIWVYPNEEVAKLLKSRDELYILRNETLYALVTANEPQVREYRHEALRPERGAFNVNRSFGGRRENHSFIGDLVREECSDDVKEPENHIMMFDDVVCN